MTASPDILVCLPAAAPHPVCERGVGPRVRMLVCAVAGMMLVVVQTGCTALLGSGGLQDLQDMLAEPDDAAVEAVYAGDADAGNGIDIEPEPSTEELPDMKADAATLADEALDKAIRRLDDSGRLDPATQEALESAVQDVPRQDWPVIIDAFVASIESAPRPKRTVLRPVDTTAVEPPPAAPEPEAPAEPKSTAVNQEPDPEPTVQVRVATAVLPTNIAPPAAEPSTPAPGLAVANACLASRVRGWGDVDRFSESRFASGQELIVYFELEHLSAEPSAAGHTTRIDTTLQLMAADGRLLHQWHFEPVEETCPALRRDYFARYLLRIPADAPAGPCRLDLAVTDTVGHCTAAATLPLEVIGR